MNSILVIGAGLIGARHVAAVKAHPRCRLVGIVEPARVDALDVPLFQSIDQVDVGVDAAIIATPTQLHSIHGAAAAKRGWHMLIEKPVASTPNEAATLGAIAETHKVCCLVGHHRRYHPSVQRLRQIIRDGGIGTPVTSTLIWAMRKPDDYFDADWRRAAGSPVMINLVHDIDLLRFVLGDVVDLSALGTSAIRNAGRVESGGAVLQFASGAVATISFSDTAPSPWGFEAATAENPNIASTGQDMWWITGTTGGIAFPSLTRWSGAQDWSQAPRAHKVPVDAAAPLDAQLSHFADVVEGRATPIVDIADATETLRTTCQLEDLLTSKRQSE